MDPTTLEWAISKCEEKARKLNRAGASGQGRVATELAMSFRSKLSNVNKQLKEKNRPRCTCCGTTENLHFDAGSGGPYRCNSADCMVF